MKKLLSSFIALLLTTTFQVSNAQCLSNDTIANQNTTGPGPGSICGIIPCENLNFLDGDIATFYTNIGCRKIVDLADSIDGIDLGNVSVCENIACSTTFFSGQPLLNRYFNITPTSNGKAYVSLYILQWDIDEYNTAAFPSWPLLDPMTNLTIIQVDTTFSLGTATSSITYIPNSSITAVYDATMTSWTISFPVDSFSDFYLSTPVPVTPSAVLNFDSDAFIKLFPNPTDHNLNLEIEAKGESMTSIQIIDVTGRILKTMDYPLKTGYNKIDIDISSLQVGIYSTTITNRNGLNYSKIFSKRRP